MDWKTFIANLVDSLAWPTVCLAAILILRKQLQSLFTRVVERASERSDRGKFEENLSEARRHAELLRGDASLNQPAPSPMAANPASGDTSPIAAVLLTYNDLYETILGARKAAGLPADTPLHQVLSTLIQKALLRERSIELFEALTKARNAAVHLGDKQSVTRGEALEFAEQVQILGALVGGAGKRLGAGERPDLNSASARSRE